MQEVSTLAAVMVFASGLCLTGLLLVFRNVTLLDIGILLVSGSIAATIAALAVPTVCDELLVPAIVLGFACGALLGSLVGR